VSAEAVKTVSDAIDALIAIELASTAGVRHSRIAKLCAIAQALEKLYAVRVDDIRRQPNHAMIGGGIQLGDGLGMGDFDGDYEMALPRALGHQPDVAEMFRQMIASYQEVSEAQKKRAADTAAETSAMFDTPVRKLDELLRVRRELAEAKLPTEAVDASIHSELDRLKAEQQSVEPVDYQPEDAAPAQQWLCSTCSRISNGPGDGAAPRCQFLDCGHSTTLLTRRVS